MRPSSVVLALSIAIVLASLSPRSAAVVERPAYARGDFWSYRTSLSEEFGFRFEGNSTVTAGSEVETDVQGERVRALEVSVSGGGTFEGTFEGFGTIRGSWTVTGAERWETIRWNTVRSFGRVTATGSLAGPPPVGVTLEIVNETTRRVTADTFAWPVREGSAGETRAHWNASQTVTVTFEGFPPQSNATYEDADFTTMHRHNGTARKAVVAGAFDAHRIEDSGPEGRVVRWFAPRVGGDVVREEYNETGGVVASSELTAFRYRAGEPTPPFPWLYVLIAGLGTSAGILLGVLALRKRRPVEVWMPPDPIDRSP